MARKYEKRRRAESEAETRRRITEATVALHREIGPAQTTVSAIAERAGVQRLTVYRHFPEPRDLLQACSAHWRAANPLPDFAPLLAEPDPDRRARSVLIALYGWYREGQAMIANIARDAPVVPHLAEIADRRPLIETLRDALLAERPNDPRAALGHALAFSTWHELAHGQGLSDLEAADLMTRLADGA